MKIPFYELTLMALTFKISIFNESLACTVFKEFKLTVKAAIITLMNLLKGFWTAVACVDGDNDPETSI